MAGRLVLWRRHDLFRVQTNLDKPRPGRRALLVDVGLVLAIFRITAHEAREHAESSDILQSALSIDALSYFRRVLCVESAPRINCAEDTVDVRFLHDQRDL